MSRETPYVYPLQRLISMVKVFRLTRLGNLSTRKDNPFRANLRTSLVIFMTRKDSPYKANLWASRGCYTVRKDSPTTLQVHPVVQPGQPQGPISQPGYQPGLLYGPGEKIQPSQPMVQPLQP